MSYSFATTTVALLLLTASCSAPSSSEGDERRAQAVELYDEAIMIHDEVMPRMDEVMRLRQQLQAKADSLYQADSVSYGSMVKDMHDVVNRLQKADEGMMQWMRNLEQVPESDPTADAAADTTGLVATQYRQKEEIEAVKYRMETGIEEAKELLNSLR